MSNGTSKSGSKSSFHFLAGLGSGVLSAALLQPIDLLKTRVQQSPHQNILRTISEIRHTSPAGLRGLWRGTVPSALRTGFGSALYFSTLNAIRQAAVPLFAHHGSVTASAPSNSGSTNINDSSRLVKLSNTGNLLAGAVARGFAGFILMPLTVIKVRYESSLYSYCSISGAAVDILRTEGPRGFFAGFGATALRDAPYAGLYVLLYEQFKRHLGGAISSSSSSSSAAKGTITSNNRMGVSSAAAVNFSSGVLAATACSIVSNPFDAVKTRIQLRPGRYRNMVYAARTMLAEEGVRSFFSGLGLRMSRKALSSALAWTLYEELIMRAEVGWSLSSSRTERAM